ncbi:uncharacterized protein KZ484_006411 [Pholidichthys leucotaenia]
MNSEYQSLSPAGSCTSLVVEMSECFICRDGELQANDPLRNFCDCKNLLAHHTCLSTWIQKGYGSEDRLRCIICKAKYQLQRCSPWRSMSFQWQTWLVLIAALALLGLVPYVVYCMMTSFTNPRPHISFRLAAATFGVMTEILLIRCLWSYVGGRYRQAERSAFTVRPRGSVEDGRRPARWDPSEAASASAAPPAAPQEERRKALKSGCLSFF